MFKRKGKLILIFVLIIQLIVPFSFLIYQSQINKYLKNDTEYIKLNIENIWISSKNEMHINFNFQDIYDIEEYYNYNYIIFETSKNNEYSKIYASDKLPKNNKYIYEHALFDFEYMELTGDEYNFHYNYYIKLYDKYTELENVASGNFNGPLTEAYALFKIHKNQYELVEIYIGENTLNEYIELSKNNQIDLARFEYHDKFEYYHLTTKDYLKVIDKDKLNIYKNIYFDENIK